MIQQNHEEVRTAVSEAYGAAISRPSSGGCCTGTVEQSSVVKLAGYKGEELEALPPEVAGSSFGCGNPLAFSEVKEGDVVLDLGSALHRGLHEARVSRCRVSDRKAPGGEAC